ncbi:hypothetical protein NB696_003941 [Xanthomonas sacchari]|uniref:hypothetical protein n=1 Tax=Xanthomonas sacchari TaxID=56458 RepID=UPI0022561429|nr:hypothetical protein [Xanthomonas sacchari]MCW0397353.1 hypothetical protein [Xanthomonas sacchari]MCW0447069.1 hypothetical protein [Xanthomonas sacchari]
MKLGYSEEFARSVIAEITPFQHLSGTEHVAPLLYSLIRMLKPQTVVEFGSGYTTPYILQALKDNDEDFKLNQRLLRERVARHFAALGAADRRALSPDDWLLDPTTQDIYGQEPVVPIPSFYAKPYRPRLYTFEVLPENDGYVQRLARLVADLNLDGLFSLHAGCRVSDYVAHLPAERLPIDFAWNDFGNKKRFFDETFAHVRSDGGVMAFHNTTSSEKDHKADLDQVFDGLRPLLDARKAELLTLLEPHKFTQRSLTVVRKLSDFKEEFFHDLTEEYDRSLLKLARARGEILA